MEETLTISLECLGTDAFWQGGRSVVAFAGGGGMPDSRVMPEDCVAFGTSGSTGEPSWIVISKQSLLVSAAAVNERLNVSVSSRWGLALPLHHVGGFGVVARAWDAGCGISAFSHKWEPHAFCEWIDREAVTHVSLVPTQIHDLVTAGMSVPTTMRAVVVGGGRLSTAIGRAARALGWPVLATYGMTETASQVATQGLDALESPYAPSPLPPLGIWRAKVDEAGCLCFAGSALFCGRLIHTAGTWSYIERAGEWWVTRDRGVILPDGRIQMTGRADDLVKVLGELVSPARVEEMVRTSGMLPESLPFAIVAVPDRRKGNRLVPVAEKEGDSARIRQAVECHNESCPGFLRLDALEVIDHIPRSPLGKIRRGELRKLL